MPEDIQKQIETLRADIQALSDEVYRNNFSGSQDFPKYSRFNSRLKVPFYAAVPATCEVGEICEVAGKLRICSAANVWTIVGVQV